MGVSGERHARTTLPPGKRSGARCTVGWVVPRAGLEGFGKSRYHRDPIPGPPRPQRVAIPAHKRSGQSEGTHRPCPSPPSQHHVGGALAAGRTNVGAVTTPVSESTHRQPQAAAESDMINDNYRLLVIQYVALKASHF